MVAVKNHYNGARNPIAQFHSEITVDTVLRSPLVADPLRLFDCSPITDGAAAVILAPLERAREFTDAPVKVLATAQASDTIALHDRRDISTLDATVVAARRAFEMARLTPAAIDLVEVHDCFTIAEILRDRGPRVLRQGRGRTADRGGRDRAQRPDPGQHLGRAEGLRPPGRRDRDRAGGRDRPAAPRQTRAGARSTAPRSG